jgi:hypothetical protein
MKEYEEFKKKEEERFNKELTKFRKLKVAQSIKYHAKAKEIFKGTVFKE